MRTIGKRVMPELSRYASGEAMKASAAFNETMQKAFPYGRMICCAKGVYRFRTQHEANLHQEEYIANTMATIAKLNQEANNE